MKERLDHHCRAIADEQWNAPGNGEPGTYMKGMVKEMQALHRVSENVSILCRLQFCVDQDYTLDINLQVLRTCDLYRRHDEVAACFA